MAVESIRDFTGRGETSSRTVQIRPENKVAETDATRSAKPTFGDLVKDFAADVNNMQFQAGHAILQPRAGGVGQRVIQGGGGDRDHLLDHRR